MGGTAIVKVHRLRGQTHAVSTDEVLHIALGRICLIGYREALGYDNLGLATLLGTAHRGFAEQFHSLAVLKVNGLVVQVPTFVKHSGECYDEFTAAALTRLPCKLSL